MKVSMNGLRKSLSGDVKSLRDIVEAVVRDDFYENEAEIGLAIKDAISPTLTVCFEVSLSLNSAILPSIETMSRSLFWTSVSAI